MRSAEGHGLKRVHIEQKFEEINISRDLLQHWPCQDDACIDCDEHFRHIQDQTYQCMLYAKNVPLPEAREITRRLSSAAKADQRKLTQQLESHGDLFMGRWKKRSKDKRAELLKRASKFLPEKRGRAFLDLTQSNGGQCDWKLSRTDEFRFAVLLPYLAMDTLKDNPAFLFALLHYRTSYSLEDWAAFDSHQFRDPWKVGMISLDFSPMCAIVHGPRYGDLVPFSAASVHRGDTVGFPRARLLFEAQANLMAFLTKVVDLTLEGANLDNQSSTKWTSMCHEGFRSSGDVAQWSTYSNQPFSAPPLLDIESIISTAKLRYDATADHLALLQTDPAYLRRYIRTNVQGAVYKSAARSDAFDIVDAHISFEIRSLYWWLCIKEEAEHVRDVRNRFRDQIQRGSPLPRRYDRALASLELVLVNHMIVRCDHYYNEFQQRPDFAKYFRYEHMGQGQHRVVRADPDPMPTKLTKDPMFWCLTNLCAQPDAKGNIDHASLFTFLEDHLANSPAEERARLDQIIFDHFSDLAANHQLLLAVRLNRPQNKAGDGYEMRETEDRRAWRDRVLRAGHVPYAPGRGAVLKRIYEATLPQGRRDATWIERHESVYSMLSEYWTMIRATAPDHMKDEDVAQLIKADLDPPHQAELAKERQTVLDEMVSRRIVPVASRHLHSPPMAEETQPTVKKPKSKTRPVTLENKEHSTEALADTTAGAIDTSEMVLKTVPTTKRAVGVFSKMYNGEASENGQTCEWDRFVHAMKDVGFSARNSTGSAVVFELDDQGKIIFHRPHPVAKIDLVMLKAMGKRLSKWFGWSKDTFVEAVGS